MDAKKPQKCSNTATGPYEQAPLTATIAKLRAARIASGKTLADVDAATGIGLAAISRIERGVAKNPRYATLARLAYALGGSLVLDMTVK